MHSMAPLNNSQETVSFSPEILFCKSINVGMHDIYRTDKLSTNMGENDIIFIAPINK